MKEHNWYHNPEVTESVVEDALHGILTGCWDTENSALEGSQIRTFRQDGDLSHKKGLIINLPDGSEFQLAIIRSR